jgi:hypothetical protein
MSDGTRCHSTGHGVGLSVPASVIAAAPARLEFCLVFMEFAQHVAKPGAWLGSSRRGSGTASSTQSQTGSVSAGGARFDLGDSFDSIATKCTRCRDKCAKHSSGEWACWLLNLYDNVTVFRVVGNCAGMDLGRTATQRQGSMLHAGCRTTLSITPNA